MHRYNVFTASTLASTLNCVYTHIYKCMYSSTKVDLCTLDSEYIDIKSWPTFAAHLRTDNTVLI